MQGHPVGAKYKRRSIGRRRITRCGGYFCEGYQTTMENQNPQVYRIVMANKAGEIVAHQHAWLCKQCAEGNIKFFNHVFEL